MLLQVKNCSKICESGSVSQILGSITTLRGNHTTAEPQDGGLMAKHSQIGNILAQVHSCGYMDSISVCVIVISSQLRFSPLQREQGRVFSGSVIFSCLTLFPHN
jgi:hypothetical protein